MTEKELGTLRKLLPKRRTTMYMVVAVGGDRNRQRGVGLLNWFTPILPSVFCLTVRGNGLQRHLLLPMEPEEMHRGHQIQCQIRDLDYGVINDHRSSAPAWALRCQYVKFAGECAVPSLYARKISRARD